MKAFVSTIDIRPHLFVHEQGAIDPRIYCDDEYPRSGLWKE